MIDFDKSLFENTRNNPLVCAHRGFSAGNVPCNTLAAFRAALQYGADIIELDVAKSKDGAFFVFHPGMERPHLNTRIALKKRSAKSIEKLRYVNCDQVKTHYGVEHLEEVLTFLKGKCYINVDKFWTDIPGITAMIRKCGVEKQVIVKAPVSEKYFKQIEEFASDLMYMPLIKGEDNITDMLLGRNIHYVGPETLFLHETDQVGTRAYADAMHEKGLVLFRNAIVYNEKDIISAGLVDDKAVAGDAEENWGRLLDLGSDIIQTDFSPNLKAYFKSRV